MAPVRRKSAAIVLLASLLTLTGGPLFARGLTHLACAAKRHDCASTPVLTQCCCGHDGDISAPPATTTDRNDSLAASAVDAGTIVESDASMVATRFFPRPDTSPRLDHPPDLPVLFSDLRL